MSGGLAILFGGLALAAAVLAVTRTTVVHALLLLLAALVALAMAFFALSATFAGVIQLLIYAGAITAVFVFVVMTVEPGTGARTRERAMLTTAWRLPAALVVLALVPLVAGLLRGPGPLPSPGPAGGTDEPGPLALGLLLFGDWAVATELVSLLLIAAMIGVRVLARRRREPGP